MPPSTYRYRLGDITLTIISEGTIKGLPSRMFDGVDEADWRPLVELDADGRIAMGLNSVHLTLAGHSILLDTGIGEPHPARAALEETWPITPTVPLVASLAACGIAPEQVTTVIFSHAHSDHIMGATHLHEGRRVPTFPRARHLMMEGEWRATAAQAEPESAAAVHMPVLQAHHLLKLVEGWYVVAPGIALVPAPGESPGHALVRIESRGQLAFYMGDLFHHPPEVSHPDWAFPGRDRAQIRATRCALVEEALTTDALLIGAHMPFPGLGKLRRAQQTVEWVPMT